jgi:hypothetical protein
MGAFHGQCFRVNTGNGYSVNVCTYFEGRKLDAGGWVFCDDDPHVERGASDGGCDVCKRVAG